MHLSGSIVNTLAHSVIDRFEIFSKALTSVCFLFSLSETWKTVTHLSSFPEYSYG